MCLYRGKILLKNQKFILASVIKLIIKILATLSVVYKKDSQDLASTIYTVIL